MNEFPRSPDTAHHLNSPRKNGSEEASSSPSSRSRGGLGRWETWGWVLFVAIYLLFSPLVLYRTTRNPGSDFPLFHQSGQRVWEEDTRGPDSKFIHYLPSVDVAAAAMFAWMPLPWAAVVWYLTISLGWVGLLTAIYRYLLVDYAPPLARRAVLGAGLLMLPLVLDHLCIGAFHILMVWLMVAGLGRVSQGRPWSGGFALGLAIWIKLLPLLGVGYLILKRKWLPAAVAVAAAVLVDVVLSLAAFGPATAWQLHCQWWETEARGTRNRMLTDTAPIDEDRLTNQSVAIVMRHLLTDMGCGAHPARDAVPLGNLTASQLQAAYHIVMGGLALGILVFCRRPGPRMSPRQWSTEIALLVLSTLWFSPLVWSYHPTAATPALALIVARSPKYTRLAWLVAAAWVASMALLAWPVARAAGVLLWANVLVGVVLVWTHERERQPDNGQTRRLTPPGRLMSRQNVSA